MLARRRYPLLAALLLFAHTLAAVAPAHAASTLVAYITDLEGNIEKLREFQRTSPAFEKGADGRYHVKAGAQFVFGGDALDRFKGSFAVARELVRLKTESPDRVVLILGNRDLNKMRLTGELSPQALQSKPYWIGSVPDTVWGPVGAQTQTERFRYIMGRTFGAPQSFELLRQELSEERGGAAVSDDAVVQAYLAEIAPGGAIDRLLALGQLSYRIGDTVIVHGGITTENYGYIPGSEERRFATDQWVQDLNRWYTAQYGVWARDRYTWSGTGPRPGNEVIEYPMPLPGHMTRQDSVITGRNIDRHNNQVLPPRYVRDMLRANGIRRLVIGHTPCGDTATILRASDGSFEVVCGDNSYSSHPTAPAAVHILVDGDDSVLHTEGQARIGEAHTHVELLHHHSVRSTVGLRLESGGYVTSHVEGDRTRLYSFHMGEKFSSFHRELPASAPEAESAQSAELSASVDHTVYGKRIAYFPGSFDPPTLAHKAMVERLIGEEHVDTVVIAVNLGFPKDYDTSAAERVDMLKILLKEFGDKVVIRGEPYAEDGRSGRVLFSQRLQQLRPSAYIEVAGEDVLEGLSAERLADPTRQWIVFRRAGAMAVAGIADSSYRTLPESVAPFSSSRARAALHSGLDAAAAGISPELHQWVTDHKLYLSPSDAVARRAQYAEAFTRFLTEGTSRFATLALDPAMALPPYKETQSPAAWLEKFIRAAIHHNHLNAINASYFAASARVVFRTAEWDQLFKPALIKEGAPSASCQRHLLGDLI